MPHRADLAVHGHRGADHVAAEHLANSLVAQANAQHRDMPGGGGDQVAADARVGRGAGAGRDDDGVRALGHGCINGQGIVADDLALLAKITKEMNEVEGEAVIVVDQ